MTTKFKFLLVFYLLAHFSIQAQQEIKWDDILKLPFKEDTVNPYKNFPQAKVIYPINESPAILEIRMYSMRNPGDIKTLQFYSDTVIAQKYSYQFYSWRPHDFLQFIGKTSFGQDIGRRIGNCIIGISAKDLLDSLIATNLFILPDEKDFKKSSEENGIIIQAPQEDCYVCWPAYCEIKLGKKIRYFTLSTSARIYLEANPDNEYFKSVLSFFKIYDTNFKNVKYD